MKRILPCLATLALGALASPAWSQSVGSPAYDPIGDVISAVTESAAENAADWSLRATLYHGGGGMSSRDSLGCRVSPMRTVAVDPAIVSRRTIIFIKETVGLVLPDGSVHDGYWYASDTGPAIRGSRIDLYTGGGAGSMRPLRPLNLRTLTVSKVGQFTGCPPIDGGSGLNVAALTATAGVVQAPQQLQSAAVSAAASQVVASPAQAQATTNAVQTAKPTVLAANPSS